MSPSPNEIPPKEQWPEQALELLEMFDKGGDGTKEWKRERLTQSIRALETSIQAARDLHRKTSHLDLARQFYVYVLQVLETNETPAVVITTPGKAGSSGGRSGRSAASKKRGRPAKRSPSKKRRTSPTTKKTLHRNEQGRFASPLQATSTISPGDDAKALAAQAAAQAAEAAAALEESLRKTSPLLTKKLPVRDSTGRFIKRPKDDPKTEQQRKKLLNQRRQERRRAQAAQRRAEAAAVAAGLPPPPQPPVLLQQQSTTSPPKEEEPQDSFLEQHNDLCQVCDLGGELICCYTCNLVFHLPCIRPKLIKFPHKDDWSCPYCIASGQLGHKRDSHVRRKAMQGVRIMDNATHRDACREQRLAQILLEHAQDNEQQQQQQQQQEQQQMPPEEAQTDYSEMTETTDRVPEAVAAQHSQVDEGNEMLDDMREMQHESVNFVTYSVNAPVKAQADAEETTPDELNQNNLHDENSNEIELNDDLKESTSNNNLNESACEEDKVPGVEESQATDEDYNDAIPQAMHDENLNANLEAKVDDKQNPTLKTHDEDKQNPILKTSEAENNVANVTAMEQAEIKDKNGDSNSENINKARKANTAKPKKSEFTTTQARLQREAANLLVGITDVVDPGHLIVEQDGDFVRIRRRSRVRHKVTLFDPQNFGAASKWQSDESFHFTDKSAKDSEEDEESEEEQAEPDSAPKEQSASEEDEDNATPIEDDDSAYEEDVGPRRSIQGSLRTSDGKFASPNKKTPPEPKKRAKICTFCRNDKTIPICAFCACRVCFRKKGADVVVCAHCSDRYHSSCLKQEPPQSPDTWLCSPCLDSGLSLASKTEITIKAEEEAETDDLLQIQDKIHEQVVESQPEAQLNNTSAEITKRRESSRAKKTCRSRTP